MQMHAVRLQSCFASHHRPARHDNTPTVTPDVSTDAIHYVTPGKPLNLRMTIATGQQRLLSLSHLRILKYMLPASDAYLQVF